MGLFLKMRNNINNINNIWKNIKKFMHVNNEKSVININKLIHFLSYSIVIQ